MSTEHSLPEIDLAPLRADPAGAPARAAALAIDAACRDLGFFLVRGHGVDAGLRDRLDALAREFFALPQEEKAAIAMSRAPTAWRGWFPLGGELTAGVADHKEGIYFGTDDDPSHPLVVAGTPLHGANQLPVRPAGLGPAVREFMAAMADGARAVLRGMGLAMGLGPSWFAEHLTATPLQLFRIFRYPAVSGGGWSVGPHTDYGLLTLLAQDGRGGLEVQGPQGWTAVPASPELLVCNLGDMLELVTGGRYRSTLHRVRHDGSADGGDRLSFPFFFDPSWDAVVQPLPEGPDDARRTARPRWDGEDPFAFGGTYGDYITAKVARVFPDLAGTTLGAEPPVSPPARSS